MTTRWEDLKHKNVKREAPYRLWVSTDRCILVRMYPSNVVEIALRDDPSDIWGPPLRLAEEKV